MLDGGINCGSFRSYKYPGDRNICCSHASKELARGVVPAMKRLFANLALAAILSTFLLPLSVAFQASGIPACCLPEGKHHCSKHSTGTGFGTKTDNCPYRSQVLGVGFAGLYVAKFEIVGPAIAGLIPTLPKLAGHRIAARQLTDRGPPALSL